MKFTAEDEGEIDRQEVEKRLSATIEELKRLLKEAEDFKRSLRDGSLKDDDGFTDFTMPIEHGYDRTGPRGITYNN